MNILFEIIPVVLYFVVGVICLVMAYTNLFSKKILPFHEKISRTQWEKIDDAMKVLIITYMRLVGMGFLVVAIQLIVCPVVNYFVPNVICTYLIPFISLIYCTGLFIFNYSLYKKTHEPTPWKGSLYAMIVVIVALIISSFA